MNRNLKKKKSAINIFCKMEQAENVRNKLQFSTKVSSSMISKNFLKELFASRSF